MKKATQYVNLKLNCVNKYIKEGAEIQTVPDVALLSHFNFRAAPDKKVCGLSSSMYTILMCE